MISMKYVTNNITVKQFNFIEFIDKNLVPNFETKSQHEDSSFNARLPTGIKVVGWNMKTDLRILLHWMTI